MADVSNSSFPSNRLGETPVVPVSLSRPLLLLYTCATVGAWIFLLAYLIEGAIRPDYNAWQQSISALSLGPGGWVQQVNFLYFGLVTLFAAVVWRLILKGGVGQTWYPIMRILEGIGLIGDGIFSQDPAPGYPKGAVLTPPTLHGVLHVLFDFLLTIAIAIGYFILARRMAREPNWGRGWAIYCVVAGLWIIILISLFGFLNGQHSEIAGLVERLAVNGLTTPFGLLVLIRVWRGAGFSTRSK